MNCMINTLAIVITYYFKHRHKVMQEYFIYTTLKNFYNCVVEADFTLV